MHSVSSMAARLVNGVLRHAGVELRRVSQEPPPAAALFLDLEPWVADILRRVRPFTMTTAERISALCHAARYIVRSNIPGDVVECGVWRGGSMMAVALTLLQEGDIRTLHLYDTFAGMPPPTDGDQQIRTGKLASALLADSDRSSVWWAYAGIREVRRNLRSTGYPARRIRYVEGKVEDTIPAIAPSKIAILRLDTDWYESTRHELLHLYPRLSIGGVLIIDDYGHWQGSRKATDEYVEANPPILLQRIDPDARLAVKVSPVETSVPASPEDNNI